MDNLSRSHDGFFRKLMSEPQMAEDYLNAFLPERINPENSSNFPPKGLTNCKNLKIN